jgi:hypothetical protein
VCSEKYITSYALPQAVKLSQSYQTKFPLFLRAKQIKDPKSQTFQRIWVLSGTEILSFCYKILGSSQISLQELMS